jgi:hypothetical protein
VNPQDTQHDVVIVGAARTPMGGFMGDLKSLTAPELGAAAIRAAVERSGIAGEDVQEVIMGNVLPAGQGQGAGTPGSAGRRPATGNGLYHRQQDVRVRHESRRCSRTTSSRWAPTTSWLPAGWKA